MASQRLPGKVMLMLSGKSLLAHLIDSLSPIKEKSDIIIATSDLPENEPIRDYCFKNNIQCFSDDENNVAGRFFHILQNHRSEYFIRLSGDSPLFDYRAISSGLRILESSAPDIITTVSTQPYPSGMHCEIIRTETFLNSYPLFSLPEDFEHVTKYFYRNRDMFTFEELICPVENATRYKFSIDTTSDYRLISKIFDLMKKPHYAYSLKEKMELFDQAVSILPNA